MKNVHLLCFKRHTHARVRHLCKCSTCCSVMFIFHENKVTISFSWHLQVRGQIQDLLFGWHCSDPISPILMISSFGNLSLQHLTYLWNLHCILLSNKEWFFNVDVSYFGKSCSWKPCPRCFLDFLLTRHGPNVFGCCRGVKDHKWKLKLMIDKRLSGRYVLQERHW